MSTTARIRAWATVNGLDPANVTATCDGERIVEINGSAALAKQAMAISQADVDAKQAADDAATAEDDERKRVASLVNAIGPSVLAIRLLLVRLGYDVPCACSSAIAKLTADSIEGKLSAEQQTAKADLAILWLSLRVEGVSDEDITAAMRAIKER